VGRACSCQQRRNRAAIDVLHRLQPGQLDVFVGLVDTGVRWPELDDLAAQTLAAWNANPETSGTPITTVVVDTSRYSGPDWNPTWNIKELSDGTTSKVTALMVNTGRADANANTSPRDEDPVGRAASAFASAVGGASVVSGVASAGAASLGEVSSPTIAEMLPQILLYSDNTAADALAFEIAIATGSGNSFDALATAYPIALSAYGIDTAGMNVVDGSGVPTGQRGLVAYKRVGSNVIDLDAFRLLKA
jgi:D-alanyl-D-alanine carboxypeptidase/D-alanyl-D-alanine-endopeptidase (penicillin-binding protein 4)